MKNDKDFHPPMRIEDDTSFEDIGQTTPIGIQLSVSPVGFTSDGTYIYILGSNHRITAYTYCHTSNTITSVPSRNLTLTGVLGPRTSGLAVHNNIFYTMVETGPSNNAVYTLTSFSNTGQRIRNLDVNTGYNFGEVWFIEVDPFDNTIKFGGQDVGNNNIPTIITVSLTGTLITNTRRFWPVDSNNRRYLVVDGIIFTFTRDISYSGQRGSHGSLQNHSIYRYDRVTNRTTTAELPGPASGNNRTTLQGLTVHQNRLLAIYFVRFQSPVTGDIRITPYLYAPVIGTNAANLITANWSGSINPGNDRRPVRAFTLTLNMNQDPGTAFDPSVDISIRGYNPDADATGWTITATGSGTTRQVTATPNDTVEFGFYKMRLKVNAFKIDSPFSDIDSSYGIINGSNSLIFEGPVRAPVRPSNRLPIAMVSDYYNQYVGMWLTSNMHGNYVRNSANDVDITLAIPPSSGLLPINYANTTPSPRLRQISFYNGEFYSIWEWRNDRYSIEKHNTSSGAHISRELTFPTSVSDLDDSLDLAIDGTKVYIAMPGTGTPRSDIIRVYNRSNGSLDTTINAPTDIIPTWIVNQVTLTNYNTTRLTRRHMSGVAITPNRIYIHYFNERSGDTPYEAFRILSYDKSYNRQRSEEGWISPRAFGGERANFTSHTFGYISLSRYQNFIYGLRYDAGRSFYGVSRIDGVPIGDEEVATPTISAGGSSGRNFYFTVFWVGVGESQYSQFTLSDVRVDSPASATRVLGTRAGNSIPVTVTVPATPSIGTVKITVIAGAIMGSPAATSVCVPYDLTTVDEPPSITLDGGSFDSSTRRITWFAYISGASSTQVAALGDDDVTISNSVSTGSTFTPTETVTRTPSSGSSYRIQTSQIPTGRTGNMSISIRANALGSSSNPYGITSSCVEYDTRMAAVVTPAATISAGVFNRGDNTIKWTITWVNATSSQLSNFAADDISISGATGATDALTTQGPNTYVVTVSSLPANSTGNAMITIRANALGTSTNASIQSTCVNYDTRPTTATSAEIPAATIINDGFCPSSRKVTWRVFWANASTAELAAFNDSADVTITTSEGTAPTPTFLTASGNARPIEVTIPANRMGNITLTVLANRVGSNLAVTSSPVAYDTRALTPVATIDAGIFNQFDSTVKFTVRWTNATTTQLMGFAGADITVSGATGTSTDIDASGPNTYVVTISDLPDNMTGNIKITIIEDALGTDTNASVESTCVNFDTNETAIPTIDTPPYVVATGIPTALQTGVNFTFTLTTYVDGTQTNVGGLRADDLVITSPDGLITPVIS